MSNTTPHYYPKYAICSIENNCGTFPLSLKLRGWNRVTLADECWNCFFLHKCWLFKVIIADQDITHCKQRNTSFSFPTFLTFSSISHMTKRQLLQLCLAFSFPQVLTVFNPFQSYYYRPNKQTNKLHSVFQGNCVYQGV